MKAELRALFFCGTCDWCGVLPHLLCPLCGNENVMDWTQFHALELRKLAAWKQACGARV